MVYQMQPEFDNRISLQKLEVFCLVVELDGVGRAAERLFVAQPVVTAHLRSFEQRLGTKLLYRDGRKLRLTECGERVYEWASETLARTREVVRDIDGLSDGRRGSVAIAATQSLGSYTIPPLLARFREHRPQARLSMHILDPPRAIAGVESGQFDFAVIVSDVRPDGPQLEVDRAGEDKVVLVVATDADLAASTVSVRDLGDLPLVASPAQEHQLRTWGIRARSVTIELGHPEAMKAMARAGHGVALMYRAAVAHELAEGVLREVEIDGVELSTPVYLARRRRKHMTPIQLELFESLRDGLTRELQRRDHTVPLGSGGNAGARRAL